MCKEYPNSLYLRDPSNAPFVESRLMLSRLNSVANLMSPDFCHLFVGKGKREPRTKKKKSSREIPGKILKNVWNKDP